MHGAAHIEQTNKKLKHGKVNGKTKDCDATELGPDVW